MSANGTQTMSCRSCSVTTVENRAVTIACGDHYELTYASLAHPSVSAGDSVRAGDAIGSVRAGALQEEALGPHLHFSVTRNGVLMDPAVYLSKAS